MAERITKINLKDYIGASAYSDLAFTNDIDIAGVPSLLQSNFGEKDDNDCFLVSLTALINYYTKNKTAEIYVDILRMAWGLGIFPNDNGLDLFDQKNLVNKIGNKNDLNGNTALLPFMTWNKLKGKIEDGTPMILSMFTSDGRGFYKKHSVTVCGYCEVTYKKKKYKFLKVKDNWSIKTSYIDFAKLPLIYACVHFYERI